MKYLIVNADDFGLTKGVSEGIAEAARFGVISSTSMFANSDCFDYSIGLLKNITLGVGVHLNLTYGSSILPDVFTLTNKRCEFYKQAEFKLREKDMDPLEIECEFVAQIEKFKDAGVEITHLDSHHHIHRIPAIREIVVKLADKYSLAVRKVDDLPPHTRTTEEFTDKFYNESATDINFKMILRKFERASSLEIMCHPGHCDVELINKSAYAKKRAIELSVLSKYELLQHVENTGVKIISFKDL